MRRGIRGRHSYADSSNCPKVLDPAAATGVAKRLLRSKGPLTRPTPTRSELEAEIQALASSDDIARRWRPRRSRGARRTRRERQDAAWEATRVARQRARRGLKPTAEEPGSVLDVAFKSNGERDVQTRRGDPTPEHIVRDDQEPS